MSNFQTIFKAKSIIADISKWDGSNLKEFMASNGTDVNKVSEVKTHLKHVALIGAGMSAESEVSYMSCNGIARSLLELGHHVTFVDMGADIAEVMIRLKPDVVFNGLHGTFGEDGCLPGILNILNIPYSGAGVMASSVGFNKKISLDIFRSNGIDAAKSIFMTKETKTSSEPMARPFVIKPMAQGSSIGVEIVFAEDEFNWADYDFSYGDILVEEYIKGREIQVAVLNGKALGTLEIKLLQGKRFYDYETKYTDGFAEHICPAPLPDQTHTAALSIAEKAVESIKAIGMIRVEFLYRKEDDKLFILEVNTHPGMTPLSICPEIALKEKGMGYTQIVEQVLAKAKYEIY